MPGSSLQAPAPPTRRFSTPVTAYHNLPQDLGQTSPGESAVETARIQLSRYAGPTRSMPWPCSRSETTTAGEGTGPWAAPEQSCGHLLR